MYLILICAQLTGTVGVHFSSQFTEQTGTIVKSTVIVFYVLLPIVILLLVSGTIVNEATLLPNGAVEVSFGAMAPLVWSSISLGIIVAITILILTFLTSSYSARKYTIFPIIGFLVMCFGALSNTFFSSYPIDIAANLIFISLVAYGVIGKNIVRPIYMQPLRLSLPVATFMLILCYIAIVTFCLKWLELSTGTSYLIALIIIIIFGAITFGPSRVLLSNKLKLYFFPDMHRYQTALSDLSHVDMSLVKWTSSVTDILNIIAKTTYADDAILLIKDRGATYYEAKYAVGPHQTSVLNFQLPDDSPLVRALTNSGTVLSSSKISQQTAMKFLIRGKDNVLDEIGLTMCCRVEVLNRLSAILCLVHEAPHNSEQPGVKDFLELACNQIATLIVNVNMYQESQREIAKRKRIAMALQESEQQYRQLFEDISDAIMVFSPQLKFLDCNEVTLQRLGYSRKEFLRSKITDIVHPDFHKALDENLKEVWQGENIVVEAKYQCKDGSIILVEVNSHKIEYKNKTAVLAVVRDISERKQAEELFKTMANNSTIGVYVVQDRKFVFVNPPFQKFTGFTQDELLEADPLSFVHPEDKDAAKNDAVQMLKGNRTSPYEFRIVGKNGEMIWTLETATSIDYEGKRATLGNTMDITERKQAEEREKLLQQELIMSSRLASIGEMAAGIAHEINNPLTGVLGFSDLLMNKNIPEDIRKYVNIINEGAQRVASITSRMLSYAHQSKAEYTTVDINDVINTTIEMQTYTAKSSNIQINTQLDPDLPPTIADAGQLQQVFLNIILNANVEMTEAHNSGNLLIKTGRTDKTIWISFKDDGPGIAKENLDKIFDPFFTTREIGKGVGLGLSVCYGIVNQHGGKIYTESTLGKGATFIVELPIVIKAEQLKLAAPTDKEPELVSGAKILIVDDDSIVCQFLTDMLGGEEHEIEIANNGNDALERLSNNDYNLILMDIKLPDINGIELYKHLQKTAKSLVKRIIFITGDTMATGTMNFLNKTKAPYVTKPFDTKKLKRIIHFILAPSTIEGEGNGDKQQNAEN